MDLKLDKKKSEAFWATWTYNGQEAQVLLQPLTRRRARAALLLTAAGNGKDKKPDMNRYYAESYAAMILDWKGIKADSGDGAGPVELPCTQENKLALLDFQDGDDSYPFFDFIEEQIFPAKADAGMPEGGEYTEKNS